MGIGVASETYFFSDEDEVATVEVEVVMVFVPLLAAVAHQQANQERGSFFCFNTSNN